MAMDASKGVGAVIVLLMLMGMGGAPKRKGKKGKTCPPFEYNEAQIELAIAAAIAGGMRSRDTIATVVAQATWPKHPTTDAALVWPPPVGSSKAALCVWGLLLDQIEAYLEGHGIPPWPNCPPGQWNNPAAGMCENEEVPLPPVDGSPGFTPFDPSDYESPSDADYPTPGTLLQVRYGDRLLGTYSVENQGADAEGQALRSIAYTTLLTAGFMAAQDHGGLDDEGAAEFAREVAYDGTNRVDYTQLIQCNPWVDALYTTFGFGSKAWESPAGRALRFLPMHYDNRERLTQGLSPRRNVELGEPSDRGTGNGNGQDSKERNFAYIWLPKINLKRLWESGGVEVTTDDVSWSDGTNGIMPPPEVMDYGVENVPASVAWGCLGYEVAPDDLPIAP